MAHNMHKKSLAELKCKLIHKIRHDNIMIAVRAIALASTELIDLVEGGDIDNPKYDQILRDRAVEIVQNMSIENAKQLLDFHFGAIYHIHKIAHIPGRDYIISYSKDKKETVQNEC